MKQLNSSGFSTRAIHGGEQPVFNEGSSGDVTAPIHLSTTFARKTIEDPTGGYEYSRTLNPTRKALEEKFALMEQANYGLAFGSGVAAISTVLISLLKTGSYIIAGKDLYSGTKRIFNKILDKYDIVCDYIDLTKPENINDYLKKDRFGIVWIESPTNPMLEACDIAAIAKICKKQKLVLIIDNTFLTPYFQNPLALGVDIVVHSTTKYICGHSDVLGGAVMLNDVELYKKIQFNQNAVGAVPSPFDCYLTMRGIKTLSLRMLQHEKNALELAQWLEKHPKIQKVIYPGLPSHPQHELFKKQARGFGGMISFDIRGDIENARKFLSNLNLIALAESLGGVESLIEHPALMTHHHLSSEERQKLGISDTFIRFSVGIEDVEDLKEDLDQALK